jgi:predicted N-acyltransferase
MTITLPQATPMIRDCRPGCQHPVRYDYTLHRSVDDIDAGQWACLRRGDTDPYLDRQFLRMVEKSQAGEAKYRYAVFRDAGGAPLADVHLCTSPLDIKSFLKSWRKKAAERVARVFPRFLQINQVYCDLTPGFMRLLADSGQAALASLDRLLCAVAAEDRARSIMIKELTEEDYPRLGDLAAFAYRGFPSMMMNHAQPIYPDFEGFLASVSSRHRWTINRARKKFAASGFRVVRLSGGEGAERVFTDEVYRLYEAVYDRAEYKIEKVPIEFFRDLAHEVPDQSSFIFVYDGDHVVAFTVSIFNEAVYRSLLCGFDYDLNPRCDLYFNLSFHLMDDAYRRGVSQDILLGYTADAFKREKLGCHQRRRYIYIKGTRPLLSRFIRSRWGSVLGHDDADNGAMM